MSTISIIGKGNMGQAIAAVAGRGGHSVQLIGEGEAVQDFGDVVVLAVPYGAVAGIVEQHREAFAGKIVVDITNPVNFETFDSLTVPADGSAAAELAAALPGSSVLKAFNTNFAATLATGQGGPLPTTGLVGGDDADAKAALAGAVSGVRVVDAGSLKRAHELEALGFLQLTLAAGEKTSWTTGFALAE